MSFPRNAPSRRSLPLDHFQHRIRGASCSFLQRLRSTHTNSTCLFAATQALSLSCPPFLSQTTASRHHYSRPHDVPAFAQPRRDFPFRHRFVHCKRSCPSACDCLLRHPPLARSLLPPRQSAETSFLGFCSTLCLQSGFLLSRDRPSSSSFLALPSQETSFLPTPSVSAPLHAGNSLFHPSRPFCLGYPHRQSFASSNRGLFSLLSRALFFGGSSHSSCRSAVSPFFSPCQLRPRHSFVRLASFFVKNSSILDSLSSALQNGTTTQNGLTIAAKKDLASQSLRVPGLGRPQRSTVPRLLGRPRTAAPLGRSCWPIPLNQPTAQTELSSPL